MGFRRNVFPVFAGPLIKVFPCLAFPFAKRFLTTLGRCVWKRHSMLFGRLLPLSIAMLIAQGFSTAFSKISTLVSLLLSKISLASSITYTVAITSSTTFVPLLTMNSARLVFPLLFGGLQVRVTRFEFLFVLRLLSWTL